MKEIDRKLIETINRYRTSGIGQQVDYEKFYLYSLITHSTAIEGSTVTEVKTSYCPLKSCVVQVRNTLY